jgi:hypothetical protein
MDDKSPMPIPILQIRSDVLKNDKKAIFDDV